MRVCLDLNIWPDRLQSLTQRIDLWFSDVALYEELSCEYAGCDYAFIAQHQLAGTCPGKKFCNV